jgi:short-subunit dehydrogenase
MRLSGTIALVTGASSGIGAATARALAANGSRVLVSGRDPARLAAVAADVGGVAVPADLAAADGPARLAEAAIQAAMCAGGDGIDIVVNNAGVGWSGLIGDMPTGKLSELVAVNLAAPMQLTRLLVPAMVGRCRGQVVFVTSIAGVTGVRGEAVYAATKAGLATFAESLAYELADHGVRVSVVVPGVIDTAFFSRRGGRTAGPGQLPFPLTRWPARSYPHCGGDTVWRTSRGGCACLPGYTAWRPACSGGWRRGTATQGDGGGLACQGQPAGWRPRAGQWPAASSQGMGAGQVALFGGSSRWQALVSVRQRLIDEEVRA